LWRQQSLCRHKSGDKELWVGQRWSNIYLLFPISGFSRFISIRQLASQLLNNSIYKFLRSLFPQISEFLFGFRPRSPIKTFPSQHFLNQNWFFGLSISINYIRFFLFFLGFAFAPKSFLSHSRGLTGNGRISRYLILTTQNTCEVSFLRTNFVKIIHVNWLFCGFFKFFQPLLSLLSKISHKYLLNFFGL